VFLILLCLIRDSTLDDVPAEDSVDGSIAENEQAMTANRYKTFNIAHMAIYISEILENIY
jgi:predicted methyltransferase MtxX (methanogen marker protein 4)